MPFPQLRQRTEAVDTEYDPLLSSDADLKLHAGDLSLVLWQRRW